LVNENYTYELSKLSDMEIVDVKYVLNKPLNQLSRDLGIEVAIKTESNNLIEDIVSAITADKPVIVCVDSFYEPIRTDMFEKNHWTHCLTIYGFDERDKVFHIHEHRNSGSLVYEKRTIGYTDLVSAYNGFLENFKNIDIKAREYGSAKVNENKDTHTYFEFSLNGNAFQNGLKDDTDRFISNMLNNKSEILASLKFLNMFHNYLETVVLNEQALKDNAGIILDVLNRVINAKKAYKYAFDRMFADQAGIRELMQQSLDLWVHVRNKIVKFIYTSRYEIETISTCLDKMDQAIVFEYRYYERIFSFF
jgi:hypothetical protein